MAVSGGRARRVIDYLNDGEELGAAGTPPRSPAAARLSLPRFRWPRLARLGGKTGRGKEKAVLVEEEVVADKSEQVPVSASAEQAARECESSSTSGTRRSDLGVGLSLLFLLTKASDEFSKVVKLRAEMEALMREVKRQVREASGGNGHDDIPEPRNPESTTSSCVTDRNDRSASAHLEEQGLSSGAEAASREKSWGERRAARRRGDSHESDDECCASVDGLEEEFRAELERLQVTYGSDVPLFATGELDSEPSDDIDDHRHEYDDGLAEIVEDEDDNDDDDDTEYNGVSAVELERRLHELLHERNLERIEELEAALRGTERKLAETEMEISLWKDAAKFAWRQ